MSILQVAKIAGVSHTTVARVVNSPETVKPETVERVRSVMRDVGYVPKPRAMRRGPKRGSGKGFKTGNVAFLTSAEGFHILGYSPVMMNVVRGIDEALASYGISMIQGVVNANRQLPPIVSGGGVDGVIIWPDLGEVSQSCLSVLRNYQRVYVMTGRERVLPGDRVLNNNEKIGILAAEYLVSAGCEKLLYIDFNDPHRARSAWMERWYGFDEYCGNIPARRVVMDIRSHETLDMKMSQENKVLETLRGVFAEKDFYDGIFFACDSLTAMIYPLLRRIGINIGEDVKVISCNNERSILAGLDPMPVSIDLHPEEIGAKAVEQLKWRLENQYDKNKVIVEIEPEIIENL